jgi:hypothetical protein
MKQQITEIRMDTAERLLTSALVNHLIQIQKEWSNPRGRLHDRDEPFLATHLDPTELRMLVFSGGQLFILETPKRIVGFSLVTSIEEFRKQYASNRGDLVLSKPADLDRAVYLYQLVIRRGETRKGHGSKLLRAVTSAHQEILADVVSKPCFNASSYEFFRANGFLDIGLLKLSSYRDFGALEPHVLLREGPLASGLGTI